MSEVGKAITWNAGDSVSHFQSFTSQILILDYSEATASRKAANRLVDNA